MADQDTEAFTYYDEPEHREPGSVPPRRRAKRRLTQHVPVRFPAGLIENLRAVAEEDGMTVSAWIRRAVERQLRGQHALEAEKGHQPEPTAAALSQLRADFECLAMALESEPPETATAQRYALRRRALASPYRRPRRVPKSLERESSSRASLEGWIIEALEQSGGAATLVDVTRRIWDQHQSDLEEAGDLFFTWQYDLRWAAHRLRRRRLLKAAEDSPLGRWELARR